MRVLDKPKVYLVQKPALVHAGVDEFLKDNDLRWPTPTQDVSDAEQAIEMAGRLCYVSFGGKAGSKTNQAYIDNLMGILPDGKFRPGPAHGAVVEHENYSFIVAGASRGFSHEQVRHRTGFAYSQLSTRYCDYENEETDPGDWTPAYVIPPLGQLSQQTRDLFVKSFTESQQAYVKVLHSVMEDLRKAPGFYGELSKLSPKDQNRSLRKAARGAAREVLPNATEALMYITGNARALWNTAVIRATGEAEAVIREIYVQITGFMEQEMPHLFKNIQRTKLWDGSTALIFPREKL
jgi:thymidylate synthase (FAD)